MIANLQRFELSFDDELEAMPDMLNVITALGESGGKYLILSHPHGKTNILSLASKLISLDLNYNFDIKIKTLKHSKGKF